MRLLAAWKFEKVWSVEIKRHICILLWKRRKFFARIIIAVFPSMTSCRYEVSVCSDSQNRSLPLAGPINMTSRKHTGIINLSVTCLKILSFSSRWQHGLPVIPFMRIPAYLRLLGGITLLWPPRSMKNRKWSQDFARRALFFFFFFWWITVMSALLSLRAMSRFDIFTPSPSEQ